MGFPQSSADTASPFRDLNGAVSATVPKAKGRTLRVRIEVARKQQGRRALSHPTACFS
jgi:hypothetical protein